MRILFVVSEALPFTKTGGLADVAEGLPRALHDLGHEVAVVLPYHRRVQAAGAPTPVPLLASLTVPLGAGPRFPAVLTAQSGGVEYFLIDDPSLYDREQLYGTTAGDYPDNPERFAVLSRAAIEIAKQAWRPDVIHCHDWQTALVPVLLRSVYAADPALRGLPSVLTVHNLDYQGRFGRDAVFRAGLPESLFHMDALEYYGDVNLLKGGLLHADRITTVSPRYAEEIQTPPFGAGLDGVLSRCADRLVGILNGVDYSHWDPATDALIAARYTSDDLSGKAACRRDLLDASGLTDSGPIIGLVSRLAEHKGLDLILDVLVDLMNEGATVVVLGKGDGDEGRRIEAGLRRLAAALPRLVVTIARDNVLAHKIEAGADMFLMPSRTEPCGLNQMYSLRYGTVPIVHATGGLYDTVQDYDPATGRGTGFTFSPYGVDELLDAVRRALRLYAKDQPAWRRLQAAGMAADFSWAESARAYVEVYRQAVASRGGDPDPVALAAPDAAPAVAVEPEVVIEPEVVVVVEPGPEAEPGPEPVPVPVPEAEPEAEVEPEPEPEAEVEPEPEPEAESVPEPEAESVPEPEAEPVPEPEAEPVPEPEAVVEPEVVVVVQPEPEDEAEEAAEFESEPAAAPVGGEPADRKRSSDVEGS
jgi:starch synthase